MDERKEYMAAVWLVGMTDVLEQISFLVRECYGLQYCTVLVMNLVGFILVRQELDGACQLLVNCDIHPPGY